jgi:predicted permease
VTVVGVAAAGFLGASPTTAAADLWIPTTAPRTVAPELGQLDDPHARSFDIVGRLNTGVSVAQADNILEQHLRRLELASGDPARESRDPRVRLLPGGRMLAIRNEDLPKAIGFPLVLVSLVLLMACGNVANMLLARSSARRREIAVRLSLGAGPSRIVRQLLTESLVLTVGGAAAGFAVARALLAWFASLTPLLPDYGYFEVALRLPAFFAAATLAAAFIVLFGLAPARRAGREDISGALKPNASLSRRRRGWFSLQNALVFQQVTASVMLLLLTGFIVVGWQRSAGVDIGFDPAQLYLARIDPIRDGFTADRARDVVERLPDRLRDSAEVRAVTVAQTLPLALSTGEAMLTSKVDFVGGVSLGSIRTERVGAGFFATIGAPILRGREFEAHDQTDDARVVLVNETMAHALWPGEDAVGRTVDVDGTRADVIGVAGDLRSAFPLAPLPPTVYRPLSPSAFAAPSRHGVMVLARLDPGADSANRLRREIEAAEPELRVFQVSRLTDDLAAARFLASFATLVYGGMGVFGLVLASIGLAGVTAQAVARRRREIGIRMALGATGPNVLWLVLRESGVLVAAGTAAGLVLALVVTRALAAFVETLAETTQTTMTDPVLLLGGPALLAGLALLACYLPARQSLRISPTTALRAE